ncbi:MAG: helix-hairpin-helix domain-containing protein [Acidimicrobiales bacterium]
MTDPAVPAPSPKPVPSLADRIARLRSTVSTSPAGRPFDKGPSSGSFPRAALLAGVAGVVVVAITAVVAVSFLHRSAAPALTLPRAGGGPVSGSPPATGQDPGPAATGAGTAETITVAAAGAVARPGVYVVPGRARVADLVAAAGGTLADADVDQLNLAAKLTDAERVYVPRKGETVPVPVPAPGDPSTSGSPTGAGGPGPIDLNGSTATQLDALPGVGPTTARAIVAYRTAHGRFRSVTDLLAVPGIGPAKLDAIRPLVTVTP